MTHEEIRNLLRLRDAPEQGCAEVNAVLDEHIGHVAERIRVLRSLQGQLKDLRARCEAPGTSKECGILQGLAAPAKSRTASRRAGVHGPQRGH
jgi:DNA-binding transcriptional MerR regulator